jgi:hypothetical protein
MAVARRENVIDPLVLRVSKDERRKHAAGELCFENLSMSGSGECPRR